MIYIETIPQTSDMGFSTGEYFFDKSITLKQALNELKNMLHDYGIITIIRNNGNICRIFDYDLYNDKQFYHNLYGWEYNTKVNKITSTACFMNRDIVIELK